MEEKGRTLKDFGFAQSKVRLKPGDIQRREMIRAARKLRQENPEAWAMVVRDDPELIEEEKSFANPMDDYSAPSKQSITVRVGGKKRKKRTTTRRRTRVPYYVSEIAKAAKLERLKAISKLDLNAIPMRGSALSKRIYGETYDLATADQKAARDAMRFKGRGDYKTGLRYASRGLGALAGGAYGFMNRGWDGVYGGAKTGYNLGASFSKMRGWGDYDNGVVGNQLIGSNSQQQIDVNRTNNSGDVFIEHTEFVQNISCSATAAGASAFQITKFPINPGLDTTFPFLSQIAQNFVLGEFQGLIFQYKPTSGESGAASNALGKIIFATNYDPNEGAFLNSVQMANEDYANSCKPSVGMIHGVETHPQQSLMDLKYIRTGNVTRDLSFFDLGNFWVATEGIPFSAAGSQILGELWVTYKVRLSRANLYGALLGLNIDQDVITFASSAAQLLVSSTAKSTNTIGCTLSAVSATSMQCDFPSNINLGSYMITVLYQDGGSFGGTQVPTASTNASNLVFWKPGSSLISTGTTTDSATTNQRVPGTGVAANGVLMYQTWITVTAPGLLNASLRFNVSAALTNNTTGRVVITQYNQSAGTTLS